MPLLNITSPARTANIEEAISDYRAGKFVIIVDDEDRENEGDLCMAAEKVTPEAINFMARFGRGLICMRSGRLSPFRLKPAAKSPLAYRRMTAPPRCWPCLTRIAVPKISPNPATLSLYGPKMAACWYGLGRPKPRWIWRNWPGYTRRRLSVKL